MNKELLEVIEKFAALMWVSGYDLKSLEISGDATKAPKFPEEVEAGPFGKVKIWTNLPPEEPISLKWGS